MGKISINELASRLVERKGIGRKQASAFVAEMFYLIQKGMEDESVVKVKGLGTFKIIDVDDRESINVNTGERVLIEGHRKVSFVPDPLMRELVNKPFSQFETVVLNEGVDFKDAQGYDREVSEPELEEVVSGLQFESVEAQPETVELQSETVESASQPEVSAPVVEQQPELPEPEPLAFEPEMEEASMAPLVDFVAEDTVEETIEKHEVEEKTPEDDTADESDESAEEEVKEEAIETDDDYEDGESGDQWKKWLLTAFLCALCFVGGYFVGRSTRPDTPAVAPVDTVPKAVPVPASEVKAKMDSIAELDSIAESRTVAEPQKEPTSVPETESKVEPKPESKVEPKPESKAAPVEFDKYEKMDVRIRTGAYRIVGTDHVEKVKATDNLSRICKRTIGPGMECYLEVYNGIKGDAELKVGQEIKIPKLEHKKKKVKKDN